MPTFAFNPTYTTGRTGTIQSWTVPANATYKIECWGAQGGASGSSGSNKSGGKGAYRYGQISLTAGDILKIIVGQGGVGNNYEGSGGGGSFVYRNSDNTLYCAAGGGAGSSANATYGQGGDGQVTEAGGTGPTSAATGGTGGNGGNSSYGSGGGGWLTAGQVGTWSSGTLTANRPGSGCKPGATYDVSGANGGQALGGYNQVTSPYLEGGFGGGASAHGNSYVAGGAGGGYSGGGGGGSSSGYAGGGGGSFVHASMTSTGGTVGARTGAGLVIITQMNSLPTSPTGLVVPATAGMSDLVTVTYTHNDPDGDPQAKTQARWRKAVV